ncbi:MAG: acyl-ACP--UDP-N-acetylglucosamine O-acyltransferase [Verrucomicrobiota bacterium]
MNIHETAIVHPKAKIGKRTTVGPWVIIEAGAEIGAECEIRARAVITGNVRMGKKNQVGYGAIIGAEPQDLAFKGVPSFVEIGDNNIFREYTTIHRGTKENTATKIGDNNFFMAGVHVAHNCAIGNHAILVNNVLLGGYVTVQDRAFLGGAVVVHQYTRIGQLAMIRGQTRIGMDVPPFFMAVATNAVCGLNRVGLKRAGYTPQQRKAILRAYQTLYHQGLNRQQALEKFSTDPELQTPEVKLIRDFLTSTQRGICHAIQANDAKGSEED